MNENITAAKRQYIIAPPPPLHTGASFHSSAADSVYWLNVVGKVTHDGKFQPGKL